MNRRGFLGLLAGATLDPERLLWRPGKLISIPSGRVLRRMTAAHVVTSYSSGRIRQIYFGHTLDVPVLTVNGHRAAVGSSVAPGDLISVRLGSDEAPPFPCPGDGLVTAVIYQGYRPRGRS